MQYKNIQYSALQTRLMKTATDFFEKEKSNSTKSKIDFINQTVQFLKCLIFNFSVSHLVSSAGCGENGRGC